MKLSLSIALLFISAALFAQTPPNAPSATPNPNNVYGAGISFNQGASPRVAGTALYAHLASDNSGTYIFTVVDALPQNTHPFTVNTNIGAGIAQKVFAVGKTPIYIPTSAGISFNGSNTGWQWSTGALASVKVKNGWHIFPNVRILKSSVSGNTGYQPIVGLLIGYEN